MNSTLGKGGGSSKEYFGCIVENSCERSQEQLAANFQQNSSTFSRQKMSLHVYEKYNLESLL